MTELIIIGMGGHSKVVSDIARLNGYTILGYLDDQEPVGDDRGLYLGRVETLPTWVAEGVSFVIAIGNSLVRKAIAERYEELGIEYVTLVHPAAIIGSGVEIGLGTVVMPGGIINAGSIIGEHGIVNSGAVVDHDCRVGDFAHVAQGAVLAGGVVVESGGVVEVGVRVGRGGVVGSKRVESAKETIAK